MATSNTQLNVTYASVVELFSQACKNHVGIGQFDTGTIDYLDANAVNKTYPLVFLRPVSSTGVVDNTRTLSFELFALDIPKLSNESPSDILSNMEMLLYEVLGYVNWGPLSSNTYDVEMGGLTPVNEAFQDRVYGWVATIDVLTPFVLSACTYPDGQVTPTPTPSPTPTPTPVSPTPTPTPVTPTPTPTPVVPVPVPVPVPAGVIEFQLPSDLSTYFELFDNTRACDVYGPNVPVDTLYAQDNGGTYPNGAQGEYIYTDPQLTQLWFGTGSMPGTDSSDWTILNPNGGYPYTRQANIVGPAAGGGYYFNNFSNCTL